MWQKIRQVFFSIFFREFTVHSVSKSQKNLTLWRVQCETKFLSWVLKLQKSLVLKMLSNVGLFSRGQMKKVTTRDVSRNKLLDNHLSSKIPKQHGEMFVCDLFFVESDSGKSFNAFTGSEKLVQNGRFSRRIQTQKHNFGRITIYTLWNCRSHLYS